MREIIEALGLGFAAKGRGETEMPPKPGIHTRPDSFIHVMPDACDQGAAGVRLPL